MKSIGIICEYNPFHNGHLYHLNKIKEMFKDYRIILVMSGNFTERGDISIIDKWKKTEIALKAGVDLVIELPYFFASQSADTFARGAIEILNELKVEAIVFGSESNDINKLIDIAKITTNNKKYDKLVKNYLYEGYNYPSALSNALFDLTGKRIIKSNDILGLSYIKEIIKLDSNIKPICIKRTNDFNDITLYDKITSSSSIRNALKNNEEITDQVPNFVKPYLDNVHFIDNYYSLIKYKVLSEQNNLKNYQTVDEGIENRILKYIINTNSLDELIFKVKTKRYTYNKINRLLLHILNGFTKEEANNFYHIEYIRILGFNNNGRAYLNSIKKDIKVPIITSINSIKSKMLALEFRTTCVYASILEYNDAIKLIEKEYKNSLIIY